MEVKLLIILICFILFLISAKKYLVPCIFKSGEFIVDDTGTWKDITGIIKDQKIRFKIIITVVLLIIFESGGHILLPGVDLDILTGNQSASPVPSSFSIKHFSVFALGVMPLISANGLVLLSVIAVPALREFSRSGQSSSRLINKLVYLFAIILSIVLGYGISKAFQAFGAAQGEMFTLTAVLILTLGVIIILLLGKGISKLGVGHGISTIIAYAWGIGLIINLYMSISSHVSVFIVIACLWLVITTFILGIWLMRVKRIIMVEDINTGEKKPLPFSLNQAGIFPVVLSATILMLPHNFIRWFNLNGTSFNYFMNLLNPGQPLYYLAHIVLIVSISLIYGILVINPNYMVMRLKRNNLRIVDERQNNKRNILFATILKLNLIWAGVLILYFVLSGVLLSIGNVGISSSMDVLITAAVFSGYLHTLKIKKKNPEEIYMHTEPAEIMVAKSYLETKGINTVTDNDEAYGWIFGFFTGPLAVRRLFVEAEDFVKASELMEEYNMKRLVESE